MGLFSTAAAAASVAEDKSSAQYALVLSSALVLVSAVALYLKYATAQKKEEGFFLLRSAFLFCLILFDCFSIRFNQKTINMLSKKITPYKKNN